MRSRLIVLLALLLGAAALTACWPQPLHFRGAINGTPVAGWFRLVTNTPGASTSVPVETLTPVPTVTATPTATITPLYGTPASPPPTLTPTLTPSPTDVIASPTPDIETPEPTQLTPGPTSTPPDEARCFAGTQFNLNVRSAPTVANNIVGRLEQGDRVVITALYIVAVESEEWGQLDSGNWIALWHAGAPLAYLDDAAPCWNLPKRYAAEPEPDLVSVTGVHVLDAPYSSVRASGLTGTLKTAYWSGAGPQYKRDYPGGVWIHRSMLVGDQMRDCPTLAEWYSPSMYAGKWAEHWNTAADYQEFMNECGAPNGDWQQFVDFTIEVMDYAAQRGVCVAWGSFATGNPDYAIWSDYLVEIIEYADAHPCGVYPDGRPKYHAIAWHQTMMMPPDIARGAWVTNYHIARRHLFVDSIIFGQTGRRLHEHPSGQVFITEYGLTDGYSGSWSDTFTCDEIAAAVWFSAETLQHEAPSVRFQVWTWGDGSSIWTDISHCSDAIAAYRG